MQALLNVWRLPRFTAQTGAYSRVHMAGFSGRGRCGRSGPGIVSMHPASTRTPAMPNDDSKIRFMADLPFAGLRRSSETDPELRFSQAYAAFPVLKGT
jgi:hypothetical protein